MNKKKYPPVSKQMGLSMYHKVLKMIRRLTSPYHLGFYQGHAYLDDQQIRQIQLALNSPDGDAILAEYEKEMAGLIGDGFGISFAAGRMAFYSLMKVLGIGKGDEVILPGFTCVAMPNAVWRTQAVPIYADIDEDTYGSSAEQIEKRITSRTKMIVAQHSFGIPCRIPEIIELAKKHRIFVLEDCALTVGSSIDGIKVGNWGDAAIFSTDNGKPINTLLGGFLYSKNKQLMEKVRQVSKNLPHLNQSHQERLFKYFLFERKYCNPLRFPQLLLIGYLKLLRKKLGLGSEPNIFFEDDLLKKIQSKPENPYPAKMPPFLAMVGLFELHRWQKVSEQRKMLLEKYLQIAGQTYLKPSVPSAYTDPRMEIIPHRFVYHHSDVERITGEMSRFIDVSAIWFRVPVQGAQDGLQSWGYQAGDCPVAERVCGRIVNWPCILPPEWEDAVLGLFKNIHRYGPNEN